jgi:hypothetical protein
VANIHAQKNRAGNTYRVLWRDDGRQRSLTFENLPAAASSRRAAVLGQQVAVAALSCTTATAVVAASSGVGGRGPSISSAVQ